MSKNQNNMEKIGIACDHAGYDLKEFLTGYLSAKGFEVFDFGCHSAQRRKVPISVGNFSVESRGKGLGV